MDAKLREELKQLRKRVAELEEPENERGRAEKALRESEEKYHNLVENTPDGIAIVQGRRLVFANQTLVEVSGYSMEELAKLPFSKLITPSYRSTVLKRYLARLAGRQISNQFEIEVLTKEGRIIPCEISSSLVLYNGEKAIQAVLRDISERRRAKDEIKHSEARFRGLFENMRSGVTVYETREDGNDFIFVDFNKAAERIEGVKKENLIGKSVLEVFPGVKDFGLFDVFQRVWKTGKAEHHPVSLYKDDRITGWRENYVYKLPSGEIVAVYDDVTKQKQQEEENQRLTQYLARIIDNANVWLNVLDEKANVVIWNEACEKLSGYSRQEVVGHGKIWEWLYPDEEYRKEVTRKVALVIEKGEVYEGFETTIRCKNGKSRIISWYTRNLLDENGDVAGSIALGRDVTEQVRTEEKLRKSEERYKFLYEKSQLITVIINMDGIIEDVNESFINTLGYRKDEIVGNHAMEFVAPQHRRRVAAQLERDFKGEYTSEIEVDICLKDGSVRTILFSPGQVVLYEEDQPSSVLITGVDITERVRAEEKLRLQFINLAETVARIFNLRDPYVATHQHGTAKLAQTVAEKMGWDDEPRLQNLYIGNLLHDIGKAAIPESIWRKPGKLTEEEWQLVRTHPQRGYDVLKEANLPWPVAELALHHHERLDGSGYPDGLKGDELIPEVRILAVCNVVEAMSVNRPYRLSRSKQEIIEELTSGKGAKYDPEVVDLLLEMIEKGELELRE